MNAPLHFKRQLADELDARARAATAFSTPGTRSPAPARVHPLRRRVVFTVGVAAAAAAAIAALPLLSGQDGAGGQAAAPHTAASGTGGGTGKGTGGGLNIADADYAVKSRPDGLVAVQLFDPKGAAGLEKALAGAGIRAAVRVPSASCRAVVHTDTGARGDLDKVLPPSKPYRENGVIYHLIDPTAIPAGDHLLFVASFRPDQVSTMGYKLVTEVPDCVPAA
ncbi:hypothetical protein ACIQU5_26035 [Streptomyces sp. NPDC090306]|uniref:hypothetical protein n=1 Tax=Streptomyces sp. NPDC090306 TaxID=3365961 RepID=UPI0038187FD5